MKCSIIVNGIEKFEITALNPHGSMGDYIIDCILKGDKIEIIKR